MCRACVSYLRVCVLAVPVIKVWVWGITGIAGCELVGLCRRFGPSTQLRDSWYPLWLFPTDAVSGLTVELFWCVTLSSLLIVVTCASLHLRVRLLRKFPGLSASPGYEWQEISISTSNLDASWELRLWPGHCPTLPGLRAFSSTAEPFPQSFLLLRHLCSGYCPA